VDGAGRDLRCSDAPAPKRASAQVLMLGADHTQLLMYTLLVGELARRCRAAVAVFAGGFVAWSQDENWQKAAKVLARINALY